MGIFNWVRNRKHILPKDGRDFCLSKEESDKLKHLDHEKLMSMDRKERLSIFVKIIGEEKAEWFNARFDKDFLLKSQQERMINWANKTEMKPEMRKEIIRRILRLEKALSQKEKEDFLNELVELKLGIGVTEEEAKTIFDLSQKIEEAKTRMENGGSAVDYEKACNNMQEYINKAKNS